MDADFNKIIKIYKIMLNKVNNKDCNRCVLIAKRENKFYITVSGIEDFSDAQKAINNLTIDVEKSLHSMYDKEHILEYACISDQVLYENLTDDLENGIHSAMIPYGNVKNAKYNHRKFSCCERKLLAKFDNNISNLMLMNYIICKYTPCYMCYPFVKTLPNFYAYDSQNIYKIIMPNNFIIAKLSNEYRLLLELTNDNCNISIDTGDNYLFVKKKIN